MEMVKEEMEVLRMADAPGAEIGAADLYRMPHSYLSGTQDTSSPPPPDFP
eukprot:COSAG02_NODE_993_length_15368_cov_4.680005_13_plen_50_part_00